MQPVNLQSYPDIIFLPVQAGMNITIDRVMNGSDRDGELWYYDLKGIIYYGDFHFVSHFWDKNGYSWVIDSQRNTVWNDTRPKQLLGSFQEKKAILLYYVLC